MGQESRNKAKEAVHLVHIIQNLATKRTSLE